MNFLSAYFGVLRAVALDRSAAMVLILSILLYSAFYPSAYTAQVSENVPLAVVDLDNSGLSRDLILAASSTQGVRLIARTPSLAEAEALMKAGKVDAILWIAPGLYRDTVKGGRGDVAIFANGAYLVRTRAALEALAGAVRAGMGKAVRRNLAAQGLPASMPAELIVRPLFNTREGYGSALVPGVMMLIVQQTLLLGIGLMLATWRGRSKSRATTAAFFGGASAFATIGFCSLFYFCGMSLWVQDYPRGGNLAGLLVAGPLYVLAIVALGLSMGSFYTRRAQAGQFLLGTSLPFLFLSCLTWPWNAAPKMILWLAKLIPTTAGIQSVVKLTQMGATLDEIAPELANLALLVLVYGFAAWLRLCAHGRRREKHA